MAEIVAVFSLLLEAARRDTLRTLERVREHQARSHSSAHGLTVIQYARPAKMAQEQQFSYSMQFRWVLQRYVGAPPHHRSRNRFVSGLPQTNRLDRR